MIITEVLEMGMVLKLHHDYDNNYCFAYAVIKQKFLTVISEYKTVKIAAWCIDNLKEMKTPTVKSTSAERYKYILQVEICHGAG